MNLHDTLIALKAIGISKDTAWRLATVNLELSKKK